MFVLLSIAHSQKAKLHTIRINPDGSFSPKWTYIHDGDSVLWKFQSQTDVIVPVNPTDSLTVSCFNYKPFDPANVNEFTGPLPNAASGIYTIGPDGPGFVVATRGSANPPCDYQRTPTKVGNQYLCDTGMPYATMDWTWQNPNLSGVFIRLRWDEIQSAPGVYDWTAMDREIEKAVRNGKLYSLSFKAGSKGTPQWIFNPAIAGSRTVKRLTFRDDSDGDSCGVEMDLGSPADSNYRALYFGLWREAARRIRERNAWFRALAYVKPSGANLFSHENRLPKHCLPNCTICNPQVWAEQGNYTPDALYEFYRQQFAMLSSEFPGKDISYQLIQDGFPLVNNKREYKAPLTEPLPDGVEQTETIMKQGARDYGLRFVVQHNGLKPKPQERTPPLAPCPNEGKHPAVPPYGNASTGCPNRWVLESGAKGQVTGFQTENASKLVSNPIELESTFQNGWDNSDAIFIEIYEDRFWEAETAGPVLNPNASRRTIEDWANVYHERRRNFWASKIPDPFPLEHRHVFKRTIGTNPRNQLFYYVNPSKCGSGGSAKFGAVVIVPDNVTISVRGEAREGNIPQDAALNQNYPNPFSTRSSGAMETTISYSLAKPMNVQLNIFSITGKNVRTLVDAFQTANDYAVRWDGKDDFGNPVPKGSYFYRLSVNGHRTAGKMLIVL